MRAASPEEKRQTLTDPEDDSLEASQTDHPELEHRLQAVQNQIASW
jgi:hypothetical protein